MKRKDLTKAFMMILNGTKTFGLFVYANIFQRFKGYIRVLMEKKITEIY